MRKTPLLALCCLVAAYSLSAQDILTIKKEIEYKNYQGNPLIRIKGEEIMRFPANNFLDAVNGLFPWIFSQTQDGNNFLYIVNNHILQDINGLSLYDIEEIAFARAPLNGTLYPFSKSGIFYIKTKEANHSKPLININTQYNVVMNKDKRLFHPEIYPPGTVNETSSEQRSKAGHFQSHYVSVLSNGKKLNLHLSSQLEQTQYPQFSDKSSFTGVVPASNSTLDLTSSARQLNLKSFLNLNYTFSDKISAGINGNYFHGQTKTDSTNHSTGFASFKSEAHTKLPVIYYHIGSYFKATFVKSLTNTIYFEYAYNHFNYQLNVSTVREDLSPPITFFTTQDAKPNQKGFLIRDNLEYTPALKGKLKASVGVNFSYLRQNIQYDRSSGSGTFDLPNGTSYSFIRFKLKQKLVTLNPFFQFSYNDLISGYAGYPILANRKAVAAPLNVDTNNDPYAGIIFNLKNWLNTGKDVDRLDLSLHYGQLTKNSANNYWLPSANNPTYFSPHVHFEFGYDKLKFFTEKSISLQLNSSFFNEKLMAGIEWTKNKTQALFFSTTIYYPQFIISTPGIIKQTLLSAYAAVKLIDKKESQWLMRFNALLPKINYDVNVPYYNFIARTYKLQSGLQNHLRFNEFYFQVHAVMGLQRKEYDFTTSANPPAQNKGSEFLVNYLLAGYDLPLSGKSIVSKLSIFLQARNLLGAKETKEFYWYDRYAGAGVNVQL